VKNFRVQLNLDQETRFFITIKHNHISNAENVLQTKKWVKDEETESYYNMDKVVSFSIYEEE
jgi:hypothetical protein